MDDGDAEVAWILAMGMACFSVVDDGAPSTDGLTMHSSLEPSSLTTGMVVLSTTCVRVTPVGTIGAQTRHERGRNRVMVRVLLRHECFVKLVYIMHTGRCNRENNCEQGVF